MSSAYEKTAREHMVLTGLEGYIEITKNEMKKIVIVSTAMLLINDVFVSGNQCLL